MSPTLEKGLDINVTLILIIIKRKRTSYHTSRSYEKIIKDHLVDDAVHLRLVGGYIRDDLGMIA